MSYRVDVSIQCNGCWEFAEEYHDDGDSVFVPKEFGWANIATEPDEMRSEHYCPKCCKERGLNPDDY